MQDSGETSSTAQKSTPSAEDKGKLQKKLLN